MLTKEQFRCAIQHGALWTFVAQLGLLVGIEAVFIAVFSGNEEFLSSYGNPSLNMIGVATSLYPVCAAIGAVLVLFFVLLMSETTILAVSILLWYIAIIASNVKPGNMVALMCARVLKGLGIGIMTSVLPLYVEKIAPTQRQSARLLTLFQATVPLGILLMALVGKLVPPTVKYHAKWTYVAIPVFPVGLTLLMLPQRQTADVIHGEKPPQQVQADLGSGWARLKENCRQLVQSRSNMMRCAAATLAQCACPITAINVVFYYSSAMCRMMGFGSDVGDWLALGLYSCNFVGSVLSLLFINKLPRLETMIYTSLTLGVLHIVLFLMRLAQSSQDSTILGYAAISLLFVFVAVFSLLFAGMSLVYTSEVVHPRFRSVTIGYATASGWLCNFVISMVSASIMPKLGSYTFLLFSYFCLALFAAFAAMPQANPMYADGHV